MYCTVDDVLSLVPEHTLIALTQDDPLLSLVNLEIVQSSIKYASDKIDADPWTLPTSTPAKVDLLKDIALDLVRHRLYSRRPDGNDLPDAVKEGKKSAETDLTKISRGELSLGIEDSKKAVDEAGPWRVKAQPRFYNGGMR